MRYTQLNDTQANFNLDDLIDYLGYKRAEQFLHTYRHAITATRVSGLIIKAPEFGELVRNYKHGEI